MPVASPKGDYLNRMKKIDPEVICIDEAVIDAANTLHVGIAIMMPDSVLKKTEEQFTLPLHNASGSTVIIPHFIAINGINRNEQCQKHIDENYISISQAQEIPLDFLILTGGTPPDDLKSANYLEELKELIDLAKSDNGPRSTLLSCRTSMDLIELEHDEKRDHLTTKRWGVFPHLVHDENDPLTQNMNEILQIPHSRWNENTEEQYRKHGFDILISSKDAGVHMAATPDRRIITMQGHPEYHATDLFGEWQRDLGLKTAQRAIGENVALPPFPTNYFKGRALELVNVFMKEVEDGRHLDENNMVRMPPEIHAEVKSNLKNEWAESTQIFFQNWLSLPPKKTDHKVEISDIDDTEQYHTTPEYLLENC